MKKKPEQVRILHISSAKSWRGGEQQIAYLAEELRKHGVEQWILCAEASEMEAFCRRRGFTFFSFRRIVSFNPMAARQIWRLCQQLSLTHLHTHDSHAHTLAFAASVFFENKTPLIVHRRVDFPVGRNFFSKWKYNHPSIVRIITVSHFIKKIMKPAIRNSSKLCVVHSGIDLKKFEEKPEAVGKLRREYGIPSDEWLIANVAAIAPHKDYFTFVKTAEILLRQGFPARFLIIGADGGERQTIARFIHEKNLGEKIAMTGFRSDIPEILPELDLLLFTSKTEGMGTSLLDAMACSVPIVATAAGGIPEIVEDEITGLLAPVRDAVALAWQVERLLQDPQLRRRLVQAARKKALNFSKEKMAERILEIYRETS